MVELLAPPFTTPSSTSVKHYQCCRWLPPDYRASDAPATPFQLTVHHFALRMAPDEDQRREKDRRTTGRLNSARRVNGVWITIEPVRRPIALDHFDNRIAQTKRWPLELLSVPVLKIPNRMFDCGSVSGILLAVV